MSTQNLTTNSLGFLRLPVVPTGTHVVKFTQTSAGANGMSILGIGSPAEARTDELPTVLVGTITYQLHGGKVRLFDTRKYMFGAATEMNDSLHPNVLGQIELSRSVEASW